MMADDHFAVAISSALRDAFASGKISTPISTMDLLLSLIASKATVESGSHTVLRLTDLQRLEPVLKNLSSRWEHGTLALSRQNGALTIMDIHLVNANAERAHPRKRKRAPVDEEADSATGDGLDGHSSRSISRSPPPSTTPLGCLSKDLREVYAILQKSTARGRLLAERVRVISCLVQHNHNKGGFDNSFAQLVEALIPSVHISPKMTVPKHVEMSRPLVLPSLPIPFVIVYISDR
jgi:mRNA (2'-O-methyladenosine-N6-)-methyltransferase